MPENLRVRSTIGVGENIIAASWQALNDAVAYCLLRAGREPAWAVVTLTGQAEGARRTARWSFPSRER
jgi:hypothetical protein